MFKTSEVSVYLLHKTNNVGNSKKERKFSLRVITEDAKNKMLGPSGSPHALKC